MALFFVIALSAPVSANDVVKIGAPSWDSAKWIAAIIKVIIEDKLNGKAEVVASNNGDIFNGMAAGKGDFDLHPDVWLPNQSHRVKENKDTVALSKNGYIGREGFCL